MTPNPVIVTIEILCGVTAVIQSPLITADSLVVRHMPQRIIAVIRKESGALFVNLLLIPLLKDNLGNNIVIT